MLREGSSAKNLKDLADLDGDFIVSDDKHPDDLLKGHVDEMLRKAVKYGIDPIKALKMVTLNPSVHYNLNSGNLVPGKAADIVFIDNLEQFNVNRVIIDGEVVANNGKPLFNVKPIEIPSTFKLKHKNSSDFDIKSNGLSENIRVIEVVEDQLITNETSAVLNVKNGNLEVDLDNDILKISVVERYGHERVSNGFVKGFGLEYGAISSSIAHDSHNIITVGTNSQDMAKAVNTVLNNKGGLSAVSKDFCYSLELPVAGLMSTKKVDEVANNLKNLHKAVGDMGSKITSPFMSLSFMALLVIPKLKIGDQGLFDVEKFSFVDVIKN